MYLQHYGLNEAPFRITPHTDFFFSGANRGATLEALLYAIVHDEGIVKISGEVGSGKTMLCRVLMERLPETVDIIYLANPSLSRDDILYALADELGIAIPEQSRSGAVMRALQETLVKRHAEGRQVVVLIDEAHAMPMETLEEIRLLSNLETNRHKLLQLVLFGQPELNATLARDDMRQLRERITHNFSLEPLVREDIERYLDFRMRAAGYRGPNIFAPAAIKLIAQASHGLTRRINILADKALLAAFANGGHLADTREVRAAIRDSEFATTPTLRNHRHAPVLWAIGGALVTLLAVSTWQSLVKTNQDTPPPMPATPTPAPVTQPTQAPRPATADIATQATTALDHALASGKELIGQAAPHHWVIQLYTSADTSRPELVGQYLLKAQAAGLSKTDLRAYRSNRYGIIYGLYDSYRDALSALSRVPEELKYVRPYARKVAGLKPNRNTPSAG
ncbi:MAG: AAA family ATPase [Rhodocyclaceae bacterium]|nr:AAA family ATPase [Rhodocyclaceae bacterium]MDZ4213839.1 AAA family ATPase [Rhodocyclaceae bacterium]